MRSRAWKGVLGLSVAYAIACGVLALRHPEIVFSAQEIAAPLRHLPASLLWGTATSAHQVDGGNAHNDWAHFEQRPGTVARGERSGRAVDHWNRMDEDILLMQHLGANAYRFSLEWSRLEPAEGVWDEAAWIHSDSEVAKLRAAGIEPMLTLLHFTLPQWLAERGGVLAPEFPERFGRFAREAARRYGSVVNLWCTLNEPNVQMVFGYVEGTWPPGHRSHAEAAAAFAALLRAHVAAVQALREASPGAQVGVAMHLVVFEPRRRFLLTDWLTAWLTAEAFNWAFYDSIAAGRIRLRAPGFKTLDEPLPGLAGSASFFGANYYQRELIGFAPSARGLLEHGVGPGEKSDLGWEIYPGGLLGLLRESWARYRLPIYVTENGIADAAGTRRGDFIRAHAHALDMAAGEGIPVRGYFHWSLLDNFEWALGFDPRFGLYRVDRTTLDRSEAPGAEAFRSLGRELRVAR